MKFYLTGDPIRNKHRNVLDKKSMMAIEEIRAPFIARSSENNGIAKIKY